MDNNSPLIFIGRTHLNHLNLPYRRNIDIFNFNDQFKKSIKKIRIMINLNKFRIFQFHWRYVTSNLSTPVFARRTELLRKSSLLVKVVLLLFSSRLCFFRVSIFLHALSFSLSPSVQQRRLISCY